MSHSLTAGAVPPKSEVDTLYAIAKPAYRTWVGNIAGKVAEIVASWGTYSTPRTAKPITAPAKFVPISRNIGTPATKRPASENHHIGFRPIRTETVPTTGRNTIIVTMPMNVPTSHAPDYRPNS